MKEGFVRGRLPQVVGRPSVQHMRTWPSLMHDRSVLRQCHVWRCGCPVCCVSLLDDTGGRSFHGAVLLAALADSGRHGWRRVRVNVHQ